MVVDCVRFMLLWSGAGKYLEGNSACSIGLKAATTDFTPEVLKSTKTWNDAVNRQNVVLHVPREHRRRVIILSIAAVVAASKRVAGRTWTMGGRFAFIRTCRNEMYITLCFRSVDDVVSTLRCPEASSVMKMSRIAKTAGRSL